MNTLLIIYCFMTFESLLFFMFSFEKEDDSLLAYTFALCFISVFWFIFLPIYLAMAIDKPPTIFK